MERQLLKEEGALQQVTQDSLNNSEKSVYSKLVIAIDGPAGAGKSTVANEIAQKLGIHYLDTGAMYRAFALKAQRHNIGPEDEAGAEKLCDSTSIDFGKGHPAPVLLDGEDVSTEIRTTEIGELASALSVYPAVRRFLSSRQRRIVEGGGVILEGRDTTTVIAPDAPIRIFLTATLEERARRRYKELLWRGMEANYEEVKAQIADRDYRDTHREDSPLRVAEGVTQIHTDGHSIEKVVRKILDLVDEWEKSQKGDFDT
jgi:cytidylate kinase